MLRLITPDARYRMFMGKGLVDPETTYEATVDDDGTITLTPVTIVATSLLEPELQARLRALNEV